MDNEMMVLHEPVLVLYVSMHTYFWAQRHKFLALAYFVLLLIYRRRGLT